MVYAVTEGEEKPLKYPVMFRAAEVVVVNKIDLLPHLDFDLDHVPVQPAIGQPDGARHPGQRADRRGCRRMVRLAEILDQIGRGPSGQDVAHALTGQSGHARPGGDGGTADVREKGGPGGLEQARVHVGSPSNTSSPAP